MKSVTKLPPSLSPQLLGSILNYARNQRRVIETDLQRKSDWERCASSEEDFYCRLHQFLQDADSRNLFNSIALKHSKKRRLDLPGAIVTYYSRKYPNVFADDLDVMIQALTPEGLLGLFARNDDPECFTNVGWAILELDKLDFAYVLDICDEYSELGICLKEFVLEYTSEVARDVTSQHWARHLNNLCVMCDQISPNIIDVQLANIIRKTAKQMYEFAETEQEEFRNRFSNEISENQDFIAKHQKYFPIEDSSTWKDGFQRFFTDWSYQLELIQQSFADCRKIDTKINELNRKFIESDFEEQKVLLQNIEDLIEIKQSSLSLLELSISNLLSYDLDEEDTDYDMSAPDVEQLGTADEKQADTENQASAEDAASTVSGDDHPPQNISENVEEPPDDGKSADLDDADTHRSESAALQLRSVRRIANRNNRRVVAAIGHEFTR